MNTLKVRVAKINRGISDPRNILGIINEVDEDKYLNTIGIKAGNLAQTYLRNQFNICKQFHSYRRWSRYDCVSS